MLFRSDSVSPPRWRAEAFIKPGRRSGWLMPLYRLLQQLSDDARRRLFPALHRGRRAVVPEVHQALVHDTLLALRTPSEHAPVFRDMGVAACFRDPRWSQVRCGFPSHSWGRLLERHGLRKVLARYANELRADPALADRSGVVRDMCILGLSGRVPRGTLAEVLTAVASGLRSKRDQANQPEVELHPLRRETLRLSRDLVEIRTEDPPPSVEVMPPWRITIKDNRTRVDKLSDVGGGPTHVGTVSQGRFSRLCTLFGRQQVLDSLPAWIQRAEQSERSRGVASAQFWRGLKTAFEAYGYIGGPELLLPPYFEVSLSAGDPRIAPAGACAFRPDRYVVDLLHQDPLFQERIRVHLANPPVFRSNRAEFLVVTRRSTLELDTAAMLERRFTCLYTYPKGSVVAARKMNWANGGFHAVQSSEDWAVWIPRGFVGAETLRAHLAAIQLTRDGVVPFDLECPSMTETLGGVTGAIYAAGHEALVAGTDGSVRKDGGMGAGVCWSQPILDPVSVMVHGPVKSVVPELVGLAIAAERAPLDQDLTILTDSKASLQLLRGLQRRDFPVYCHARTELPLLERAIRALNKRVEAGRNTRLVKVRAHAGEPLNTWADQLASSASEEDPTERDSHLDPLAVYLYCEDQPGVWTPRLRRILTALAASRAYERFTRRRISLDLNPAADAARTMNSTETWLARGGVGRPLLGEALQRMAVGPKKRRVLQTIGKTFPGQAMLHRWNRVSSPICPLCGEGPETLAHIQCGCRRLEGARTAAHHLIARKLWAEVERRQRGNRDDFSLGAEVEVRGIRELAPRRCADSWRRRWANFAQHPSADDLGRLRPDAVAIRWDRRELFLLDVTRPYDARLDFALTADEAKIAHYQPVVDRFNEVGRASGWTARVLPFPVGIRGTLDERAWTERLDSLGVRTREIPQVLREIIGTALEALDVVYDARSSILRQGP